MDFNNNNDNSKPIDSPIDLDSLGDLILKSTKEIIEEYEYILLLKEDEPKGEESTKTYKIR